MDLWQFAAGLGLFLFGMSKLEESLSFLAGRSFKLFLRRHTQNIFKSIVSGTVATAILQSSSVVTLMAMALVGAGVLHLQHVLGIILGSNLGTTFTGWIVAWLGFNVKIEVFALPCIALGTLGLVFLSKTSKAKHVSGFIAGFGFLFFGLSFMKSGLAEVTHLLDVNVIAEYNSFVFLLVGFGLTAIIQSSSATMVITLSALNAGIFTLPQAAAMVIGADLGTTMTAIIGSLKGRAGKKQVALAHFLFNFVTDILAFVVMIPLLSYLKVSSGINDPLFLLVLFHSAFNLMGIALFFPFLNSFADFLKKQFIGRDEGQSQFLNKEMLKVPEAAILALENEVRSLLDAVSQLNKNVLHDAFYGDYEKLKSIEGEILDFGSLLQQKTLQPEHTERLSQLMTASRNSIQSMKSMKDIRRDMREFSNSASDQIHAYYKSFNERMENFRGELEKVLHIENQDQLTGELLRLKEWNQEVYNQSIKQLYDDALQLDDLQISTLLNVNREVYLSIKAMVLAVSDYAILDGAE